MRACAWTDFAGNALLIVAADDPVRPGVVGNRVEIGVDVGLERKRIPRGIKQRKIQWQVETAAAPPP